MESYDTLVQALRCETSNGGECWEKKCQYLVCGSYAYCNAKRIMVDAADAIETLLSTNAWNEQAVNHLKGEVDKVVHCKDCKWYSIYEAKKDGTPDKRYSPSVCLRGIYAKRRDPDWYCADGERREG